MTNDELARQYREAMTCDRVEPPDVAGWWMFGFAGNDDPAFGKVVNRDGELFVHRGIGWMRIAGLMSMEPIVWGRCPLPDPAACDDDEPATKAWIDSLTSEGWPSNERCVPFFLYCGSTVMIAGILAVGPHSTATRGDVRRVAKVFGVELREGK